MPLCRRPLRAERVYCRSCRAALSHLSNSAMQRPTLTQRYASASLVINQAEGGSSPASGHRGLPRWQSSTDHLESS